MKTFRSRLTTALAGSTAAFLSLFCLLLYLWCRAAFLADLDGDLEAILRADFAAHEAPSKEQARPERRPHDNDGSHLFKLLVDLEGKVMSYSGRDGEAPPALPPGLLKSALQGGPTFLDLEFHDDLYRTLTSPVKVDSRPMLEVLGISQEPMQESLRELRRVLGVALLVGIVLVALVSNRVAAYLTNPLERILNQLESVTSTGDPALRLTGRYEDREMVGLQRQVNAMLERLEASFRSQQQFISNASHELRAPLANLTLAIDVCLRRPRAAHEYREALETCLGETKRLTEMSNQLLQLSKSDEGALVVQAGTVELLQLSRSSLARKEMAARDKGIRLIVGGGQVSLPADPVMIAQVLDNLLDNAIRYSPAGSTVTVFTARRASSAEISVSDAGPGLSAEQIEHIFERFYRADPSRQRGTGGTGLGLAISRAIAHAHGGELLVKSVPGEGTTFTLQLPLSELSSI